MDRRPPYPADFGLIVASQSPRRHSLLADLGVPFRVVPSGAEEELEGYEARVLAQLNALAKVRAAVLPPDVAPGSFVLGTDTVVATARRIMGKPDSEREAADMLAALSGRTHVVISGVALLRGLDDREEVLVGLAGEPPFKLGRRLRVDFAVTEVDFGPLQEADIKAYVDSGEWKGKAGAYAIQGLAALFAAGIRGEYSNVVGLPLGLLARMFDDLGFDLLSRTWS